MTASPSVIVAVPSGLRAEFFTEDDLALLGAAAAGLAGDGLAVAESVEDAAARFDLAAVQVVVIAWGAPRFDDGLLDRLPSLRLIAHTGASVKPFVSEACFERGVAVTQAGAGMARSVAEVSLAFTLALLHRIPRFDHALHAGAEWADAEDAPARHELLDAPVGVVGASRTGRAYLGMLRALGARVLLADPTIDDAEAEALGATLVPLSTLLAESRVVALHAPSLPETRGMIGAAELATMPDGAALVNTARSWLVDEEAMIAELRSGRIDAALDVFDDEPLPAGHELRTLPNVLLVPHKAAGTVEGRLRQGRIVVDEVGRFCAGESLLRAVSPADLERMA